MSSTTGKTATYLAAGLVACLWAHAGMGTHAGSGAMADKQAAKTKRLTLSAKGGNSGKKVVRPGRNKASKNAMQDPQKTEDHPSVVVGQDAGRQSEDEAQDIRDAIRERTPLGEFTLIQNGEYDPTTMETLERLRIEGIEILGQGSDPQSSETGWINIQEMILKLQRRNPDGIHGWLELDFETPFVPILREGASNPRFHEIRTLMTSFVVQVKNAFPEAKVTVYNVPALSWSNPQPDGSNVMWPAITSEQRAAALARLEDLRPLLDEMDWFLPRFYDIRPTDELTEEERSRVLPAEIDYRIAHVEWLRTYVDGSHRPGRKIIPAVRTRWVRGATSFEQFNGMSMPRTEFLDEQVKPALENGADGVFIWSGGENYALHIAFTSPQNWSDEVLERTYDLFRRLGVLGKHDVPNWQSTEQKRAFQAALAAWESPYIGSTARLMREQAIVARPSEEEPLQETDEAKNDTENSGEKPVLLKNQSIRTNADTKGKKKPSIYFQGIRKPRVFSSKGLRSASAP